MARGMEVDGDLVRRLREALLKSQARTAEEAGVTIATLSRIENGHPATVETLEKLSRVLGVEAEDLLAGREPDFRTALADLAESRSFLLREEMEAGTLTVETVKSADDLWKDVREYLESRTGREDGTAAKSRRIVAALEDLLAAVEEGYDHAIKNLRGQRASVEVLGERRNDEGGSTEQETRIA